MQELERRRKPKPTPGIQDKDWILIYDGTSSSAHAGDPGFRLARCASGFSACAENDEVAEYHAHLTPIK